MLSISQNTQSSSNLVKEVLELVNRPNSIAQVCAKYSQSLQRPNLSVAYKDITFYIYRAKSAESQHWISSNIARLVLLTRLSYHSYHRHILLVDDLDLKSEIVLVRIDDKQTEDSKHIPSTSYLSLRLIPATGQPQLNEDLRYFEYVTDQQTRPLNDLLNHALGIDSTTIHGQEKLFSISRLGSVRPYNQYHVVKNKIRGLSMGFWLAVHMLMTLIDNGQRSRCFITSMYGNKIHEKVSSLPFEVTPSIEFTPLEKFFGLTDVKVRLRRDSHSINALKYGYPTGFLDILSLAQLLKRLVCEQILTTDILDEYISESTESFFARPNIRQITRLGELFTTNGSIKGCKISGEQLRQLIDDEVAEGQILRIASWENLQSALTNMVDNLTQ